MGMKLTGKDRVWGPALAAVMLSYFIWGFRGSGPLMMLAFIPAILLALSFAVPLKYHLPSRGYTGPISFQFSL